MHRQGREHCSTSASAREAAQHHCRYQEHAQNSILDTLHMSQNAQNSILATLHVSQQHLPANLPRVVHEGGAATARTRPGFRDQQHSAQSMSSTMSSTTSTTPQHPRLCSPWCADAVNQQVHTTCLRNHRHTHKMQSTPDCARHKMILWQEMLPHNSDTELHITQNTSPAAFTTTSTNRAPSAGHLVPANSTSTSC